jgi:hypothetical protein
MLRTVLFACAVTIYISFDLVALPKACEMKRESQSCQYWGSKIDAELKPLVSAQNIDETNPQMILDGIDCLLHMKGNKHRAKFSGATKPNVSQLFKPATVEVAALYYISYLYYQKWDHADAIALRDEKGRIDKPESVRQAYQSYKKWFEEVKRVGVVKAREMKLRPLAHTKVHWY